MKHLRPELCFPSRCVDGSCPLALANEYGFDVVGIPFDFSCSDCSEHFDYCEDCILFSSCSFINNLEDI